MSKKLKLLIKLRKIPSPKDFPWSDLVTLLRQAGFEESCESGSHYMFEHVKSGFRFGMSKTHPSGILKRYQIDAAKSALEAVNAFTGDSDE